MDTRPFRSVLYIPGSKERALHKATTLPTDAIIFDLEDAVAIDEKPRARRLLADTLQDLDYGPRVQLVRINALNTEWGADDLDVISAARPEAILLPKVDSAAHIEDLARRLDARPETADTRIWAMMESPLGVFERARHCQRAAHGWVHYGARMIWPRIMGLRYPRRPDAAVHVAANGAACGKSARVGRGGRGVFNNAFRDGAGLRAECEQGRDMGFDGKTLIHPSQLEIANTIFAPSSDEIDTARRQIDAYNAAVARGEGVAVLDGKIVENLHIVTAKANPGEGRRPRQLGSKPNGNCGAGFGRGLVVGGASVQARDAATAGRDGRNRSLGRNRRDHLVGRAYGDRL